MILLKQLLIESTRGMVGVLGSDGKSITAVYTHFDSYPDHNGKILKQAYNDEGKVKKLIAGGDISILGSEIGQKHDFDKHGKTPEAKNWTLYYG